MARLADAVRRGADSLAAAGPDRLLAAWQETVAGFRDTASAERRALDQALAPRTGLSHQGLTAGLEAVLGGVAGRGAAEVFQDAARRTRRGAALGEGHTGGAAPVLVLLASNLPALAVQPLLPILALGRPAVLKSSRAEPLFTPAFVADLARREPACGEALAALTWRGGDPAIEAPLLAAAGRVIAYGDAATMADLDERAGAGFRGKLLKYGPKVSLAVIGPGADPRHAAAGLARDVALFDQRGCLSVVAVYCARGMEEELAGELATALADRARAWPPGATPVAAASAVRQARDEAAMRDLLCHEMGMAEGTVIVEPRPALRPSPGLRTVRIHPLPDLADLPAVLIPWQDRLQGVALAGLPGGLEHDLRHALTALGVSRHAPPGDLQTPDTRWHNGGLDPLQALAHD